MGSSFTFIQHINMKVDKYNFEEPLVPHSSFYSIGITYHSCLLWSPNTKDASLMGSLDLPKT